MCFVTMNYCHMVWDAEYMWSEHMGYLCNSWRVTLKPGQKIKVFHCTVFCKLVLMEKSTPMHLCPCYAEILVCYFANLSTLSFFQPIVFVPKAGNIIFKVLNLHMFHQTCVHFISSLLWLLSISSVCSLLQLKSHDQGFPCTFCPWPKGWVTIKAAPYWEKIISQFF